MYTAKQAYRALQKMNWRDRLRGQLLDKEGHTCATGAILLDAGVHPDYLLYGGSPDVALAIAKQEGNKYNISRKVSWYFGDIIRMNDNKYAKKKDLLAYLKSVWGL